jgi:hypothetical protein
MEKGLVEETVEFGVLENQRFVYALSASTEIVSPCALLETNRIAVLIPESQAVEWAKTNQTGIRAEQLLGANKTLQILIEKDFACLEDRPGEDESDSFPHPETGKTC